MLMYINMALVGNIVISDFFVLILQERINQRKLKVHEKTTYTSRVNTKTAAMRKIADDSEDEFVEEEKKKEKDGVIAVKDDPQFTLAITRGRQK